MPCNCDHMEPTQHEAESRRVAKHLVYVYNAKGWAAKLPEWIAAAASDLYGNAAKVHVLTEELCTLLGSMSRADADRIVYDGRSERARNLASWWEAHQEADREKEERKAEDKARAATRKRALAKLSVAERAALGV